MNTSFLLHVPKERHYVYPFRTVRFVNYMSVGLIPIAAYATDNGYPTKIIHIGLEKILDTHYDLEQDIAKDRPKVIGISLHWHHSSYDVIELARKIKKRHKEIFIVLGGYTASFFAHEILSQFKFIDSVIGGEGEVPWLVLLHELSNSGNLYNVPNLAWRDGDRIVLNEIRYVADKDFLNSLDFTRFTIVKHSEYLPKIFWIFSSDQPKFNNVLLRREVGNIFYFTLARGCNYDCFYCGGGREATRIISKRDNPALLSPNRIVFHTKEAIKFGFTRVSIALDPNFPRDYFEELFNELSVNNLRSKLWFTIYGLPTEWFIDKLSIVFDNKSGLTISLDTASEMYRKKTKTLFFTNDDFFKILNKVRKYGFRVDIFFTDNLPGQTKEMKQQTRQMIRKIKHIYRHANIFRQNMDIDPACPLFLLPDKFGVITTRGTFIDYYHTHANAKIDQGFVIKDNRDLLKMEQFPVFNRGLLAIMIKFIISTPIAHIFLKLYLFICSCKLLRRSTSGGY